MAATALFDSSALILYFNDALSIESIAVIRQAIENATGAISVVTRAEVPVVTANPRDFERVPQLRVIRF